MRKRIAISLIAMVLLTVSLGVSAHAATQILKYVTLNIHGSPRSLAEVTNSALVIGGVPIATGKTDCLSACQDKLTEVQVYVKDGDVLLGSASGTGSGYNEATATVSTPPVPSDDIDQLTSVTYHYIYEKNNGLLVSSKNLNMYYTIKS